MTTIQTTPAFPLGRTVITRNAQETLHPADVQRALCRHVRRDWGECVPEDAHENDNAVLEGSRLMSVYRDRHNTKFWIITEWDRSVTTILLPEDY